MKKFVSKKISITIAIPTRYGGMDILPTIESIKASKYISIDRIILVADRIKISSQIKNDLLNNGVEVIWNETEGTMAQKIKQMLDMCNTDIFITTQDDVIFKSNTVKLIADSFKNNDKITMVATAIKPLAPNTFMESVIGEAIRIPGRIASMWNKGDNYLAASGRCISFRTQFLKKFRIPIDVVNNDAFLYFENKKLGGKMQFMNDSAVYIRSPKKISEQIGPSSRYQISKKELSPHFNLDISKEYRVPVRFIIHALIAEFVQRPFQVLVYFGVFLYTRVRKLPIKHAANPMWTR